MTVHEGERLGDVARGLAGQGVLRSPAAVRRLGAPHRPGPRRALGRVPHRRAALAARAARAPHRTARRAARRDHPGGTDGREVVTLLAAAGLGSEETFRGAPRRPALPGRRRVCRPRVPEGYLFPDTYSFPLETPPERVLRHHDPPVPRGLHPGDGRARRAPRASRRTRRSRSPRSSRRRPRVPRSGRWSRRCS